MSRGVSRGFRGSHSSVRNVRLVLEPNSRVLTFRRRLGGSLILSIVYGIEAGSQEDQFFANAQQATYSLGPALLPGAFLVDWIPLRECSLKRVHPALISILHSSQVPSKLATRHRIPPGRKQCEKEVRYDDEPSVQPR